MPKWYFGPGGRERGRWSALGGFGCLLQPAHHNALEIDIRDIAHIEIELRADGWKISDKPIVQPHGPGAAGQLATRHVRQPIADLSDCPRRIAAMGMNIHSRQVGDESLITEWLNIENQCPFELLILAPETLRAQKEPQFQGHVEARETERLVQLGPRKVVDAIPAFLDQPIQLFHSHLPAIVKLARRTRTKRTGINAEDQCLKEGRVCRIERTVDKDIVRRNGGAGQA